MFLSTNQFSIAELHSSARSLRYHSNMRHNALINHSDRLLLTQHPKRDVVHVAIPRILLGLTTSSPMSSVRLNVVMFMVICASSLTRLGFASLRTASDGSAGRSIKDFISLKIGRTSKPSWWYYTGWMRNPLTGAPVVGIEGVEAIQSVACAPRDTDSGNSRLGSLEQSFLSKKLLAFVDRDNKTQTVTSYRVRRLSPRRQVSPATIYSEKVTLRNDSSGKACVQLEWPGSHRILQTNKIVFNHAPETTLLDGLLGRKKLSVANYISGDSTTSKRKTSFSWRKWVSFGPASDTYSSGRSQEYYTIDSNVAGAAHIHDLPELTDTTTAQLSNNASTVAVGTGALRPNLYRPGKFSLSKAWRSWSAAKPEAVLTYRRYGEAPPWFAVGQPCIVELTGYRYSSRQGLPAHVRELVYRVDPSFFDFSVPVPPCNSTVTTNIAGNNTLSSPVGAAAMPPLPPRRSASDIMTLEWFALQKDPADAYTPWFRQATEGLKAWVRHSRSN
jgi:hypothetical protein